MNSITEVILNMFSKSGDYALAMGLAGIGSAIGIYSAGVAVFSVFQYQKQNEGKVDASLGVFALFPSSQLLYGIGLSIFLSMNKIEAAYAVLIALFSGITIMMSAIFQGKIVAHAINAMGKAKEGRAQTLMIAGAIEFVALAAMGIGMVLALFLKQ